MITAEENYGNPGTYGNPAGCPILNVALFATLGWGF